MSAAPLRKPRTVSSAGAQPRERTQSRQRPELRAVSAPEQARSLAPFAWGCVAVVLAAMLAVLMINTAMSEGAYERRDLKIEIAQLHQQRASLISELESNSSPTFLAKEAAGLGMEPAESLGFVSLTDGSVLQQGGKG
ncbi:hypothetical protein [Demequina sp. NBRC 110056]|uniref:hypothetical protein n=1 Tax=Demequina sp. NBRC 110056 TaxID=1570345 RepID=UPI000A00CC75|nr:hypothetical protein [Demequina sp. NBRC 110056]